MTVINYKGTGSTLSASEFNTVLDKIQSGLDSIFTGSVVISGTAVRVLSPAGTGSPTTWGRPIQAGSGVTSAGSVLWVVFGTAFTSPPFVTVTSWDDADANNAKFTGSPAVAGSIRIVSEGAARRFAWHAIGA